MYMFTPYGHIKTRNKITDFLMILAWASPFKCLLYSKWLRVISMIRLNAILVGISGERHDCHDYKKNEMNWALGHFCAHIG